MLTLPIQKQWFDEILAGTKTIEYREIKPYWTSRFLKVIGEKGDSSASFSTLIEIFNNQKKHIDIQFRNGYEPDSPSFIAECWIDIGNGEQSWSYSYERYYRIHIVRIRRKRKDDSKIEAPPMQDNSKRTKVVPNMIKVIDNINTILRDDLKETIKPKSKVSIAAACFSMYAYNVLKKQLESVDELRFIFTSPTFITEKAEKQKREFYIPRLSREQSLYGTEFEIKLRNEMTQKAIAQECADWIRRKVRFKSNTTGENMGGFMTVGSPAEEVAYMPLGGFTTVDIGCERGNNSYNMVNRMEAPFSTQYIQLFDSLWNDREKLQDVTDVIIDNITSAYN